MTAHTDPLEQVSGVQQLIILVYFTKIVKEELESTLCF